jgi:hypothetical protein
MSKLFPNLSEKVTRWAFNGQLGKSLSTLFDLQMWCFGCDIRRAEGNLLTESGFTRRSAGAVHGSSHYFRSVDGVRHIHLWGFAVVACDQESAVSLRRFDNTPLFADRVHIDEAIHRPQDLPHFSSPRTRESRNRALDLMLAMTREFANYESFVSGRAGAQYRLACISGSRRKGGLQGRSLGGAWGELAQALQSLAMVNPSPHLVD